MSVPKPNTKNVHTLKNDNERPDIARKLLKIEMNHNSKARGEANNQSRVLQRPNGYQ